MKPRTFWFIAVFVGLSAFTFYALATPIANTEEPTSEEQKVLLDCRHSDYRTYIKCLKRQKRHHLQHGDPHLDIDGHCMEMCLKKCEGQHDCDKSCSHCLKRTKHKHQIITEYEAECVSGDCTDKHSLSTTNITTNIDINNVINTGLVDKGCENGKPCKPNVPWTNTSHCCPTCHPPIPCPPFIDYPSIHIVPQLTLVPQLTFGLSFGPIGGCIFPYHWPCIQPYSHHTTSGIDCSGCGNPFLRYRCDVACYTVQGTQQSPNYSQTSFANTGTTCNSPYCIGGT